MTKLEKIAAWVAMLKYAAEQSHGADGEFRPCIFGEYGQFLGHIGKETNYTDGTGEKLYIGDLVLIESEPDDGGLIGLSAVIEDESDTFILGIRPSCCAESGTVRHWSVRKVRPYHEIADGATVDFGGCSINYALTDTRR